jgi:cellulose synthase/poly-beta-1,6-N-acetylglucosamine synthase-like glycosyltransferase
MILFVYSCLGFIFLVYVAYPLLVSVAARFSKEKSFPPPKNWPSVNVVIAVNNEESHIAAKIESLLACEYPPNRLKITVVSDGSDDLTNTIIESWSKKNPAVELIKYSQRLGKAYALNLALSQCAEEIVVFTDARQKVNQSAITSLVTRLQDPTVGAVSGSLFHYDPKNPTSENIGLYWRYERWLRENESRIHSTVQVSGCLYAMRAHDYTPIEENTILDDVEIPLRLVRKHLRIVLEPKAIAYDELQISEEGERRRKIRTLTGNIQTIVRNPWLFSPWQNHIFLPFLLHKTGRLIVPYALIIVFVGSALTVNPIMRGLLISQIIFYGFAGLGYIRPQLQKVRAISFALMFSSMNLSAIIAFKEYLTGRTTPIWQKT